MPGTDDDLSPGAQFVPMVVEVAPELDFGADVLVVDYDASDPANIMVYEDQPTVYEPAPGALRIWTVPGDRPRSARPVFEGGSYVIPGRYPLELLGFSPEQRAVTLYVEGLQTSRSLGNPRVHMEVDGVGSGASGNDTVRLTVVDLQLVTQGPEGEIVNQEFTFNGLPSPELRAEVRDCALVDDTTVAIRIHGTVSDWASGLVANRDLQLQSLKISPQNQETWTITLGNQAAPAYPWQPYRFAAEFEAEVVLRVREEPGEYWVSLATDENVAGLAAEATLFVARGPEGVLCPDPIPVAPGTRLPTLVRVDAPEGAFDGGEYTIDAFEGQWPMERADLGDGPYWYALDSQEQVLVLLPALYAKPCGPYCAVAVIDKSLLANLSQAGQVLVFTEAYKIDGLIVDNADVSSELGKISNYAYQIYNWGTTKKHVYRSRTGGAGHLDNALDTEIKWRYIRQPETVADFKSKAAFAADVAYRKTVVQSAKAAPFTFGYPDFNPQYWVKYVNGGIGVKSGQKASAAVADIFGGTYPYSMHCLRGATCVVLQGASTALGTATFDLRVKNDPLHLYLWTVLQRNTVQGSGPQSHAEWIPGDWGYIKNNDPSPASTLEGENIIYIGGNFDLDINSFSKNAQFWGHGGGVQTLEQWYTTVNNWSSYPASILSHRDRFRYQ